MGTCGADVPGEWFSVIFRIFCAFWLLQTSCHVLYVFYEVCGSSTGQNSGHSTYFHAPDASESYLSYFLCTCSCVAVVRAVHCGAQCIWVLAVQGAVTCVPLNVLLYSSMYSQEKSGQKGLSNPCGSLSWDHLRPFQWLKMIPHSRV